MTRRKDELGEDLERLARSIATAALAEGVSLPDRIETMKVLTTYFVGTRKIKTKKPDDEDPNGIDFSNLQRGLRAVT